MIQLLAKGADNQRPAPMQVNILNQHVDALIKYDSEPRAGSNCIPTIAHFTIAAASDTQNEARI
jgi:hypothetical protein